MIKWIKDKLGITDIQNCIHHLTVRYHALEDLYKKATQTIVDERYHGNTTVIIASRLGNEDTVRIYNFHVTNRNDLKEHIKHLENFSKSSPNIVDQFDIGSHRGRGF